MSPRLPGSTYGATILVAQSHPQGVAFGCVLGTMVSQLTDRDECARVQAAGFFAEWRCLAGLTLRRLKVCGQLRRDANPDDLAPV